MMDELELSGNRRRRRDVSSFFSPTANKTGNSFNRRFNDIDSTPTSSRTVSAELESLVEAIQSKDVDSFSEVLLRNKNIDVNQVLPGYPMTLLHYSVGCSDNDPTICEALLMRGGDPNNMDIEERVSPLHLSALYDYDRVMSVLIDYGGDLKIPNGEGETISDIVKRNVEDELLEGCFTYLFPRSREFRKSMGVSLATSQARPNNNNKKQPLHESGSDGFYSCDSQNTSEPNSQYYSQSDRLHSIAKKLYPFDYTNLMTEDESADASDDDEVRKKLTTIPEESGIATTASSPQVASFSTITPSPLRPCRGIGSMTQPIYVLTDDSISLMSDTDPSCVNSTPPITPQPTQSDLERLKNQMRQLQIPVTPSTYGVMSKFSEPTRMQILLSPKTGASNFSPELQAAIQNPNLLNTWAALNSDFQESTSSSTPIGAQNGRQAINVAQQSKSCFNYLLLDPRHLRKVNFSADHLKSGVIDNGEKFQKFLESVFYIGKGHARRPLEHLVEAKKRYAELGRKPLKNGEKIDTILEIWRSGQGVILVKVFDYSSVKQVSVYEASMIDAMGLSVLTNVVRGSYNGTEVAKWPQKAKNQLGSYLLYRGFRSFLVDEGNKFYPEHFC